MHCPRCNSATTDVMSRSQGAWDVYLCRDCLYSWRTTEPDRLLHHETYDPRFRLTPEKISRFNEVPAVPPAARRKKAV